MEKKQFNPVEEFEKCLTAIFEDAKRKFNVDLRAIVDSTPKEQAPTLTKQQEDVVLLRENE